jgi:pyridoxal phosphate enzyme (YggS family)
VDTASKDRILANYNRVIGQIEKAARSVDRDPGEIRLVVVTKGHPIEAVRQAISAGLRVFGENYAEEGVQKILACSPQTDLEWHMIGHIQSRKVRLVCEYYQYVHSLDSLKLANRLDRCMSSAYVAPLEGQNQTSAGSVRRLPVLLECNVSGEETKSGWPAWKEAEWVKMLDEIAQILASPNLEVRGLMTMAPFLPDPEQARSFFQRLRHLQQFLQQQLPQSSWQELSMGMSDDFMVAIQEGATLVRIGTAIMGSRTNQSGQELSRLVN